MAELAGEVAIVAGTSSPNSIGQATELALAERGATEAGLSVDEMAKERDRGVAVGCPGSAAEIASTMAFLAGPHSSSITGAALPVSGRTPVGLRAADEPPAERTRRGIDAVGPAD